MRYIAVCEKGSHAQDIPWFKWAHRGPEAARSDLVRFCRAYKELRFDRRSDRGEGLASLQVKCHGCGHARSLAELVTKNALHRDNIRCEGRQPWERADAKEVHYKAIFDDKNRIMVMICHNTDLGDGWEREGESEYYFHEFSEKKAYPLGINIIFYAMTH
jgi:hypothetical protein